MDPRSITAQPEDTLTIYAVAGAPKHRCHCSGDTRVADPPFRKVYKKLIQLTSETGEVEELEEASSEAPCMHYSCTYVSVTPKLGNMQADWPQKALLVPGNEVIFSLETASDYLNEYNKANNDESRFGYRCLCIGYEDGWSGRPGMGSGPSSGPDSGPSSGPISGLGSGLGSGLATLEMELIHLGAACAARLLAPDLDIPPLTRATIVEVQTLAMTAGTSITGAAGSESGAEPSEEGAVDESIADESEALLLSRGLELASPPAVHTVLDGLPLLRCISTERQFLADFVSGAESTAGGRLARWLAPGPRVEPSRCEIKPPLVTATPASRISLPIIVRDQYGDIVISNALRVEVVVQRLEDNSSRASHLVSEQRTGVCDVPYQSTVRDTMNFQAITMMKPYQNYSFEEIRLTSGTWAGVGALEAIGGGGRVPAERIIVDAQRDGSYLATWVPRVSGTYIFRCTLDDHPVSQDLRVDVVENAGEELGPERWVSNAAPFRMRRYVADSTSGLRVRASPSLQSEELGRVPSGARLAFVEELVNKDGTWVRLSGESAQEFAEGSGGVGWCMQYNRQLDRTLLQPADDEESQEEYMASWSGFKENQAETNQWQDDEGDSASNDLSSEDQRFPFSIQCDLTTESEGSMSPFMLGEPSKRDRHMRTESSASPSPKRTPRRNNGNSDEWSSPVKQRSSEDLHDAKESAISDSRVDSQPSRVAQTGTQTSPENSVDEAGNAHSDASNTDESESPKRVVPRDRPRSSRSRRGTSPPPLPARSSLPRKHALSPAQAESLRAVFAALLWHEGTVHDAIACAAFLKFHPQLPKAGARVVTRPQHEVPPPRPQRHSVEVSNAGQYLHIHPSTLESLTRSGTEASTSRARKTDIDIPIREEDAGSVSHVEEAATPAVVNVLPPALRALVALWDALNEAEQLNAATDKSRKDASERNENEDSRLNIFDKRTKELKGGRAPLTVRCELCGGTNVPPPLAAHMRNVHPGCHALTSRGYDRNGLYKLADPLPTNNDASSSECGQLAQDLIGVTKRATLSAYQLWYIYCGRCRERALKAAQMKSLEPEHAAGAMSVRPRLVAPSDLDHLAIRDNAVFLLDLAPLTNSDPGSASRWCEIGGRSPPTPPGSVWQPAPPFQCLSALGAAPKTSAQLPDTTRYHSLGRPSVVNEGASTSSDAGACQWARVPRSVSMGQAGGRDLAHAARPPLSNFESDSQDTLTGAGSSLLAQPSAALQKLVGGGEWASEICAVSAFEPPQVDPEVLMRSPVLAFILAKRDLPAYRQKMDASVRINTVRQYAFEAMNWLLRSTTQPTSVHDVMWWFCNALDKYARIVPPPFSFEDNKENAMNFMLTASAAAICPGGRAARGARAAFHAFLGSVSALAPSLAPASAAALQAVRCWALHYSHHDRAFLHRKIMFGVVLM